MDLLAGAEAEEEGPEEADRRAAMEADSRAGAGAPIRCRCSTLCISSFCMSLGAFDCLFLSCRSCLFCVSNCFRACWTGQRCGWW